MKTVSVLNDVLGPVMRGPSSSHTAGAYHIGRMARDLLGQEPKSARFLFDRDGSLAEVYRQQGSNLAFPAGLLRLCITEEAFGRALDLAAERGLEVSFRT